MDEAKRVQGNVIARHERRLLDRLCRHVPNSMQPDHLTLFGMFGAFVVFAGYAASRFDDKYLWLSTLGFLIHWAGDSLDGSLARYRNATRPRYGYFVDHSVDAFCLFVMMLGLGTTHFVRMDVALFFLAGYLLLAIYVFLNNQVTGVFQLSFIGLGPTEMRLSFVALNAWIYFGHAGHFNVSGAVFTIYDIAVLVAGAVVVGLFATNVFHRAVALRSADRDGRKPAARASEAEADDSDSLAA